jgi:hypothetical protein
MLQSAKLRDGAAGSGHESSPSISGGFRFKRETG